VASRAVLLGGPPETTAADPIPLSSVVLAVVVASAGAICREADQWG
jgi:hypothetical protein